MSQPRIVFMMARRPGKTTVARELALVKAHVNGYTKKDGTFVKEHDTKAPAAVSDFQLKYGGGGTKPAGKTGKPGYASYEAYAGHKAGAQGSLFGGGGTKPAQPEAWHPKVNDDGKKVPIYKPHQATPAAAWSDASATATVVPGGELPAELHGVAFEPWSDAPDTLDEWFDAPGQNHDLDEPDFDCPPHKDAAAGVVIQEPDGRVWMVSPTNQYGGYRQTFPKGRADDGLPLQATAIKEAFEETGMQVEIVGHLGDFERTQTYTRYYLARRVGGTPADMGWESQAVRLAPPHALPLMLNGAADKPIIDTLAAG